MRALYGESCHVGSKRIPKVVTEEVFVCSWTTSLMMLATLTTSAKEVTSLAEKDTATIEFDNVIKHFDRIMSLLKRKCKGRCSLKRVLEEYCAFRLAVLYFEKQYGVSFDDEAELAEELGHIVEMFEGQNIEASE
jgi:hypothetical protein